MVNNEQNVVFFDGLCGLCSGFVDFVLKIDKKSQFKFSPLQSDFAQKQLPQNFITDLSTVVIMIDGKLYTKGPAVLELFRRIGGRWAMLAIFRFLPKGFINFFYDLIARNRYLIMKKKETCRLPGPEEREKFLL